MFWRVKVKGRQICKFSITCNFHVRGAWGKIFAMGDAPACGLSIKPEFIALGQFWAEVSVFFSWVSVFGSKCRIWKFLVLAVSRVHKKFNKKFLIYHIRPNINTSRKAHVNGKIHYFYAHFRFPYPNLSRGELEQHNLFFCAKICILGLT